MNTFIKRHYAFLYYKHYILKKGIKPVDFKLTIGIYLFIYLICLFPISFILGKVFVNNFETILSNITLIKIQIIGGVLIAIVFTYVHIVIKKADYRNYQFNYKRDNIFYTIYEITPFMLFFVLVMLAKQF